jgi:hypothetical protein
LPACRIDGSSLDYLVFDRKYETRVAKNWGLGEPRPLPPLSRQPPGHDIEAENMQKITPFLWFDTRAEEAANLYVVAGLQRAYDGT